MHLQVYLSWIKSCQSRTVLGTGSGVATPAVVQKPDATEETVADQGPSINSPLQPDSHTLSEHVSDAEPMKPFNL